MRSLLPSLAIAVAICAPLRPDTAFADDDALARKIEQLATPWIESEYLVGISIGVIRGESETTVHLGQADENGNRADDHTIYEIGSASKAFTALLVADAVVRGEVTLDQPARELLPDGVTMPVWKDREITLGDLATHRSGLPLIADNMPVADEKNPYADYSSDRAYEFLNGYELTRAPGDAYEYSNLGMSLAGHLISRKTGLSYEELLRQRIAGPLGMQATAVELSPSLRERLATPFLSPGAPTCTWECSDLPGAGGIRSSLRDMLKFAAAQLDPPDSDLGRAIDLAWREQHGAEGAEPAMALGWHIVENARWHNGQTGGSHSMLIVDRDADLAVVLLANTALMELDGLAFDVALAALGRDVEPRELEKPVRVAKSVMEPYVGEYQLAPGFVFTVSLAGNQLMVGLTGQPALPVYARSETEWFYMAVDATLKFQRDDDGACHALQLLQNGLTQTATRIESQDVESE